jgi:hypothetical protein
MDLLGLEPRASASFDGQLFYLSDCKGSDLPTDLQARFLLKPSNVSFVGLFCWIMTVYRHLIGSVDLLYAGRA